MKKTGKIMIALSIVLVLIVSAVLIYYFGKNYEFYSYAKSEVSIPGLKDGFTPQGICYLEDDTFLISGYMKNTDLDSRIYFVDGKTGNNKYFTVQTDITN